MYGGLWICSSLDAKQQFDRGQGRGKSGSVRGDWDSEQRLDNAAGGSEACVVGSRRAAGNYKWDDGERDGRKRILVSDYGDEHTDELRRDWIAGWIVGEYFERSDFGDADGGCNLDGDAECDERERNRERHSDRDDQPGSSCNHKRDDGERRRWERVQLSDYGDEHPNELWRDWIAGRPLSEHCDWIDFGDTDNSRDLYGNAKSHQCWRNRECGADADDQPSASRDHKRSDGEWRRRDCVLVSDYSDQHTNELRCNGIAGRTLGEHWDRINFGDAYDNRHLDGDAECDECGRHRECHVDGDDQPAASRNHQRDDSKWAGRNSFLISDYRYEYADELWSDRIASRAVSEQSKRLDFGDSDDSGNFDGDTERDERGWHRQCHADADDQPSAARNHERHDGGRDSRNCVLLSNCSDEHSDELRGDRIASRAVGEHRDRINFGGAYNSRKLDGDAQCDERGWHGECDSDRDDQPGTSRNHKRDNRGRGRGNSVLVSDYGDEHTDKLRSNGIARGTFRKYWNGLDFGDTDDGRKLDRDAECDKLGWNRERHTDRDDHGCATGNHKRNNSERRGRKCVLVSDYSDEYAHQLRSNGIARGTLRKHRNGLDFGDTDDGRSLDSNAECDECKRNRQCDPDINDCSCATRNYERDDSERRDRKCVLVSDYRDEHTDELRRDGITGRAVGKHRNGTDFGNADDGGNRHSDAERDERRGHRKRLVDSDNQPSASCHHKCDNRERRSRDCLLVSDYSDEHTDQLWSDGIAGGFVGEHGDWPDLGDTDGSRNLDGDAERDQCRRHGEWHSDDHGQPSTPGHHKRNDGERRSRSRLLLSDCGNEHADQLWSDGIAGRIVG